jgi:opacity protein-like surface antigen
MNFGVLIPPSEETERGMRKAGFVVASLVVGLALSAGIAASQTAGNVYFGYSYFNTDVAPSRGGLNGWQATLEGKVFPHLGIVTDLTGDYGSLGLGMICPVQPPGGGGGGCATYNVSTHEYNVMFGPRVGVTIGKWRPFGEFEVGVAHVSASSESNTSFAMAFGGGVDYKIFHAVAWRGELDYVHTSFFSAGQSNIRISTGIVLRF